MVNTVPLKSLSTGLIGSYPETHLGMDPDLVVAFTEEPTVEKPQQVEADATVEATTTKRKS